MWWYAGLCYAVLHNVVSPGLWWRRERLCNESESDVPHRAKPCHSVPNHIACKSCLLHFIVFNLIGSHWEIRMLGAMSHWIAITIVIITCGISIYQLILYLIASSCASSYYFLIQLSDCTRLRCHLMQCEAMTCTVACNIQLQSAMAWHTKQCTAMLQMRHYAIQCKVFTCLLDAITHDWNAGSSTWAANANIHVCTHACRQISMSIHIYIYPYMRACVSYRL